MIGSAVHSWLTHTKEDWTKSRNIVWSSRFYCSLWTFDILVQQASIQKPRFLILFYKNLYVNGRKLLNIWKMKISSAHVNKRLFWVISSFIFGIWHISCKFHLQPLKARSELFSTDHKLRKIQGCKKMNESTSWCTFGTYMRVACTESYRQSLSKYKQNS